MAVTEFQKKVYSLLRKVPKGTVTTYGELARAAGIPSARAIGQALKRNPYAPEVPCHRVVRGDGRIGGFAGKTTGKEIRKKIALLRSEGVGVDAGRIEKFDDRYFGFSDNKL